MKIQCDVCDKEEATVFCPADEAVLCDGCDGSIHHANKLAGKHDRFSLLRPTVKDFPLCDICQERRAFLFCKEDRAILCRECDLPIHKANEHTQLHNRFLLTGVKLSSSSSLYNSPDAVTETTGINRSSQLESSKKRSKSVSNEIFSSPYNKVDENQISDSVSISTSSISEYLIETIPGWRVEDLLDPSSSASGFCENSDHSLTFADQELETNMGSFSPVDLVTWVPQVLSDQSLELPLCHPRTHFLNGFKEIGKANNVKTSSRKWRDDGFTVPEISPPSLKKSRHFR